MKKIAKKASRLALVSCVSMLAVSANFSAMAQDESADAEQDNSRKLDTITVTGSRVQGEEPVGSSVIALDRQAIEDASVPTIDRILKEVPQVFDLGVSENSRGQAGGNGNIAYGNSVNLRGIGPYATLVLVDGHRVVNNSRSTDPSILPTLGVERLEIVADGASAIYGSDAIAGVVNLIPRRTLDGAEILARYGMSDDGDFDESSIGAAVGKVWDSGQAMIAVEHVNRSNLSGDDRDFFVSDQTALGGADYRVNTCAPGTIIADGETYAIPADGLTAANVGDLVAGTQNLCNSHVGQDLFPEQTYTTVNGTFTQDVTGNLTFTADAYYSTREFTRHPAYDTGTLSVPETNAFFVPVPGVTGGYQIAYNFRNDLPRNTSTGDATSWQVSPGFEYAIGDTWQVEGLVSFGRTEDLSSQTTGLDSRGDLGPALASSDPDVAFDPYGLGRTSAATLAALSDQIFIAPTNADLTAYELHASGELFDIPGGAVKVAVGYERQEWDYELGLARGAPGSALRFRYFDRTVDSMYGEVFIPVIGAGNAVSGIQELDLSFAVRQDDYSDVGDTTNPKIGINYRPTDSLLFKASYGTSFRAPLITQIYGNSNAIFGQSYQNPAGGAPLLGFAQSGPNLDLKPEEAETWSVGFDWEPTDEFRFGVTYFDVLYENQVETYLADLAILSREDEFEGTGIILRGDEAAARIIELLDAGIPLARGAFPGGDPANVDLYVDGRNNNLGKSETKGFDINASYDVTTPSNGRFVFDFNGTYLTSYEVAITGTAPLQDRLNEIFQPLKFKARTGVTWEYGDWRSRVVATYVNAYDNIASNPTQRVDAYLPIDISVARSFDNVMGADVLLQLELRNAFDEEPPYVNLAPGGNGSGGYDATAANPIGRVIAVSLRSRF